MFICSKVHLPRRHGIYIEIHRIYVAPIYIHRIYTKYVCYVAFVAVLQSKDSLIVALFTTSVTSIDTYTRARKCLLMHIISCADRASANLQYVYWLCSYKTWSPSLSYIYWQRTPVTLCKSEVDGRADPTYTYMYESIRANIKFTRCLAFIW